MNVAVVIVTFNGEPYIEKCLNHIVTSSIIPKTYLIDNKSSDKTCDIASDFENVNLITLNQNIGFGQANNIGIETAINEGARHIFLINQDVYISPDLFENIIALKDECNNVGIISPVHLNGMGDEIDARFQNYLHTSKTLLFDSLVNEKILDLYEFDFLNAAAWYIPIETFETIGGFDPIFFHYGEDVNFCQRLKFHNLKIFLSTNNFVRHDRIQVTDFSISNLQDEINRFEIKLKTNYGNVNNFDRNNLKRLYKKLLKDYLKSLLGFNKKKIIACKMKMNVFDKSKLTIIKSVKKNRKQSSNYLNLYIKNELDRV